MTVITDLEQRTVDVDVRDLDTRGRTVHGYAALYGVESRGLPHTERIAQGAFTDVLASSDLDVVATLNHDENRVLGRTRAGTLRLSDEERGLRFELDLPNSPTGEDVREAISRGDLDGASFRFKCGEDRWEDRTRTITRVAELHDICVATVPAYPAASVELRTRPPRQEEVNTKEENVMEVTDNTQQVEERTVQDRLTEATLSVRPGETRSLTNTSADPISPPELSQLIFDRLRSQSVLLASGVRVIATDKQELTFPTITGDVTPDWYNETEVIAASDPVFGSFTVIPKKLAVRTEFSNEVIDDSDPSVIGVVQGHIATLLGLKLDAEALEGNHAKGIKGLANIAGVQTLDAANSLANYDIFLDAVGKLQAANVQGPYAVVMRPEVVTALSKIKTGTGSNETVARPADVPEMFVSSQLAVTAAKSTAYVYAPAEVILIRRLDAELELDRSRLFDRDMSELRGKVRIDLVAPRAAAVVKVTNVPTV